LILAAFRNHIGVVRLLLALKVDRYHRDKSGRTARDYAAGRGRTDPIYQLLGE
jgi:ankyrin repeat protein